jgi:hypothetical protein
VIEGSPAAQVRRLLVLFREEGLSFEEAVAEAFERVILPADDREREVWVDLFDRYGLTFHEARHGESFATATAALQVAFERLAARELEGSGAPFG